MITSILDVDFYKLTVGAIIFKYFRGIKAKYLLTVRNGEKIDYWSYVHHSSYGRNIENLKTLSLTEAEAVYLRSLNLFEEEYIQFLSNRPMDGVDIRWEYQGDNMYRPVPYVCGAWERAMLYEIFCLSIGNEMFSYGYCSDNQINMEAVEQTARFRLVDKISTIKEYFKKSGEKLNITEFGTRRRLSKSWQEEVVSTLAEVGVIDCTSNVLLAMKYGLTPRGTMGHEIFMGAQGLYRIQDSQKSILDLWLHHWGDNLKIALDDTLGTQKFLRDFTKERSRKYDGLRHDSGDWRVWAEERIDMYFGHEIDPKTKTLFFSDGLDVDTIIKIHKALSDKVNVAFGIGTNLTNDSFTPVPQVVMKIVECNGQPVCKLSNNPAKASCVDPIYLEYVKHVADKY